MDTTGLIGQAEQITRATASNIVNADSVASLRVIVPRRTLSPAGVSVTGVPVKQGAYATVVNVTEAPVDRCSNLEYERHLRYTLGLSKLLVQTCTRVYQWGDVAVLPVLCIGFLWWWWSNCKNIGQAVRSKTT